MNSKLLIGAALAAAMTLGAGAANAASCTTKAAVATSSSAESARWFALETMVQHVSWGLWPGFVATGNVEGYRVMNKRYNCRPDGGMVTCHGRATFCRK